MKGVITIAGYGTRFLPASKAVPKEMFPIAGIPLIQHHVESLVAAGIGTRRSEATTGAWPIFVGHMPDAPDNAMCIYDTAGIPEGRLQGAGITLSKPGWQVRVRARTHQEGIAQMKRVQTHLDTILREAVTLDDDGYTVQAVTQTSTMLPIGKEPGGKSRDLLTLNGTITLVTA